MKKKQLIIAIQAALFTIAVSGATALSAKNSNAGHQPDIARQPNAGHQSDVTHQPDIAILDVGPQPNIARQPNATAKAPKKKVPSRPGSRQGLIKTDKHIYYPGDTLKIRVVLPRSLKAVWTGEADSHIVVFGCWCT